jgi:hypothetical protein
VGRLSSNEVTRPSGHSWGEQLTLEGGSKQAEPGVPPVTTQGGSIGLGFVISNGGQSIHGVVAQFANPGATGPVPPSTIHVDRVDFWKVASEQNY